MLDNFDLSKIPMKGKIVGLLTATTIVGYLMVLDPKLGAFVGFSMMVIGLISRKFGSIFNAIFGKRKRDSMTAELTQQSAATPAAISEKSQMEKLHSLRANFLGGLEKFRAAGKDIYKLPWYVIVGEPGAGKTEVIRHCDVGFPPGMQENEFQGVGGTINMNWWFTNRAVILDTAGRLLFEKVQAGSTGEWREFLKLLRKHRPNCPVNGLLLAIPADSLIRDNPKKIEERAGWIARQLEGIQAELDIRFPVYVVITKCDLLNGFREFFQEIENPDEQRQMLGWSNPDGVDQPFRPELVADHLETVVERLREVRLRLLQDPVARDESKRRLDEVDRPYAFPISVSLIADRLRHYLSIIFVPGEWSARPLFLRGIYFTSSLQEGAELDQELANVIGVPIDNLPAGGVWKRETTLFLRDLFLEKVFPEWGLVTRASDTKRVVRRRRLAVLGSGMIALLLLGLFSWLGYGSMKASIGHQSGYWMRASEGWTAEDKWLPIATEEQGRYTYQGEQAVGRGSKPGTRDLFDSPNQSLVNFHATLRELTEQPLRISPVFRPFAKIIGNFDSDRRRAQRIVLEGSVVHPLLDLTRAKIIATDPEAPTNDAARELDALVNLIRVESGIVKRSNGNETITPPNPVLKSLLAYTVGEHTDYDVTLPAVVDWIYTSGDGAHKWPSPWMSGGSTLGADKPGYNRAIDVGIDHFSRSYARQLEQLRGRWDLLAKLIVFLRKEYARKEMALWQASAAAESTHPDDPLLQKSYADFAEKDVAVLGVMLDKATQAKVFGDRVSLVLASKMLRDEWTRESAGFLTIVDETLKELTFAETKASATSGLLREIREKLQKVRADLTNLKLPEGAGTELAELERLDSTYLMSPETKTLAYKQRAEAYALSISTIRGEAPNGPWVATRFRAIEAIKAASDKARQIVYNYQGENVTEFRTLCGYWLDYAQRKQIDACWAGYLVEARERLKAFLHFPLVFPPEDATALTDGGVMQAADLVAKIHEDLQSKTFTEKPAGQEVTPARASLEKFSVGLNALDRVLDALVVREQNRLANMRIYLLPTGAVRAQLATPSPTVDQFSSVPAVPMATPDFSYEMRLGAVDSKTDHRALSKKMQISAAGAKRQLMVEGLSVSRVFHAHFWITSAEHREVEMGRNWVAIRLLLEKRAETTDRIHWVLNMKKPDGGYPWDQDVNLEFEFEKPLPTLQAWPRKEALLQME